MKEDYTIEEGVVKGLPPGQFQFGERYVECRACGVLRPGHELRIALEGEGPSCKDMRICVRM
jgi:hypothetical protein